MALPIYAAAAAILASFVVKGALSLAAHFSASDRRVTIQLLPRVIHSISRQK
jgi:hypothetical protein